MAITASPYGKFLLALGTGAFNLPTDTLKVMLLGTSYAPDLDTDEFLPDVSPHEITGTNYTAGGQALTGVTWTYDAVNNRAVLAAANLTWPAATLATRYGAVYKSTGVPTTSRLVGLFDFGSTQSVTADEFVLNATGNVFRLKVV